MTDAALKAGLTIDAEKLGQHLGGVEVYPVVATTGRGFEPLKVALGKLRQAAPPRALSALA